MLTSQEREILEVVLERLIATPVDQRTLICGHVASAGSALGGDSVNHRAMWRWPTARSQEMRVASRSLYNSINAALDREVPGSCTIDSYLEKKLGIPLYDLVTKVEHIVRTREVRIAWVRHMLENW
ncbi:hypothetical protein BcepSauron_402 [Burkholderia phage BcepSauron]|uniref:Uncharacterized protein n=1 Tax=Burkholderia phage BcepSauron TaxID=2530033 RepID=A0A482MNI9_9CAUD|nr:hypothetical protein H1O17_gp402 [Burkholderia phage BcepSauron]QBQ74782.1 hypothetical protein BcepSauron_402 [Burkholderia phage BcepSauron]